jgi:phosphoribosyl 1,2-cyclic phosphodiesterase
MGGRRIGYTSDTEYFEGISAQYAGCDLLIANVIKPGPDSLDGHLYTATAARLISEARPRLALMTHIGMKLMRKGPEKEAEKISRLSGVRTLAAFDGMKIRVP